VKILAIQPFLKGYNLHPVAGGKDKAALEIGRALVRDGHQLDILPLPWGVESRNAEALTQVLPVLLSHDGLQARALRTLTLPDGREIPPLLWRWATSRRMVFDPGGSARDVAWAALLDKRRSIRAALASERYDVVLVHQTGSDFPVLARRYGYSGPIVLVHHSAGCGPFVDLYDYVVFVSEAQRAVALAKNPGLAARSSTVYYFAGDEYFAPIDPQPRPEIVFIGILDSTRKGLDLLLEAYERVPDLRSVRLHVVGDGPLRGRFEARARASGLPVTFHGRISHRGNAELLARAGAYVMPSRGEGLALVYLEALCMGVPIVGFPRNVRELSTLLAREVGFPFEADVEPVAELAARILALTSDQSRIGPESRRAIAAEVRARFSLEAFHRNYAALVRRCAKGTT